MFNSSNIKNINYNFINTLSSIKNGNLVINFNNSKEQKEILFNY